MENQIKITTSNGELVVSSRQVAENFGKEHSKVIRSIEGIANFGDTQGMFHKVSYVNEQNGQEYKSRRWNGLTTTWKVAALARQQSFF